MEIDNEPFMERAKRVYNPDCWYPSFEDGTVEVYIHANRRKGTNRWRVSVWGDDDFGMEKGEMSCDEAFREFRKICDGVTKTTLRSRGFVQA